MVEQGTSSGSRRIALEICVDTPEGPAVAAASGADRIELCSALALGGLTPGPGLLAAAAAGPLPAHALIRPRAGSFRADADDLDAMLTDIRAVRSAGLAGLVVGIARADGTLDRDALAGLVDAAGGLEVTLHRVIDTVPDPLEALETAIGLGIRRVLTSGGAATAAEGAPAIARLVAAAAGRIEVMAGGGVTPEAAPALIATGVVALHASCATETAASEGFGATRRTDPGKVAALAEAMREPAACA